jgi:hypothetical protein
MIVFAIQDDYDPLGGPNIGHELHRHVLSFSNDNTIDEVVDGIYAKFRRYGLIDCLYLVAHGNAGRVCIGDTLNARNASKFSRLNGAFSSHSRFNSRGIEIHGCAVASGTEIHPDWLAEYFDIGETGHGTRGNGIGYDFMRLLAQCTQTKVTGPIDEVYGLNVAFSYRGFPTMTVNPDGTSYFSENKVR